MNVVPGPSDSIETVLRRLAQRLYIDSCMNAINRFWDLGVAIDRAGNDRYPRRFARLANARKRLRRVLSRKGLL